MDITRLVTTFHGNLALGALLASCLLMPQAASAQCTAPAAPTAPPAGCAAAATPLDPAYCRSLDDAGIINVMCPWDASASDYVAGGTDYAHPDDDCDDTYALHLALTRASTEKQVVLPAGITGNQRYLLSSPLSVVNRHLVGERNAARTSQSTRLKIVDGSPLEHQGLARPVPGNTGQIPPPAAANADDEANCYAQGAMLWAKSGPVRLESLAIEADDSTGAAAADYGLYAYKAHGRATRVHNIDVSGSARAGFVFDSSNSFQADSISAQQNALDGIVVINGNAAQLSAVTSQVNGRHGIVLTRRDNSIFTGGMTLSRCTAEVNGTPPVHGLGGKDPAVLPPLLVPGEGHGILVSGIGSSLVVDNCWVEGNEMDGIRAENAGNIHILHNRIIGTASWDDGRPRGSNPVGDAVNHAIALDHCERCIVRGNQINQGEQCAPEFDATDGWVILGPGEPCEKIPNYQDIVLTGDYRFPYIAENIYDSGHSYGATDYPGGTNGRIEVMIDDGVTKTSFVQHQTRHLGAASMPIAGLGQWRRGDIVWNSQPDGGEEIGWVCVDAGPNWDFRPCQEWRRFGKIE